MLRIFIADDHAIVRHGLRQLIEAQPDMRLVGEARDGRQVLLAADKDRWDVLILDLSLPRVNGIEVLRRLRSEHPKLRVIVLSMYPEEQYAARLRHEGAAAYLSKEHPAEVLLEALRKVAAGRPVDIDLARPAASESPAAPHETLSAREYQIFTLLLRNQRVTDIAAELDLSVSTVSNHVAHIKDKLAVRSIGEIISYGHRMGLISAV